MLFSRSFRHGTGSRAALGALASVALLACSGSEAGSQPRNVVLVCIDTLRADHLGAYGYDRNPTTPNLDRLAESSMLFEDVWATSGWTKPSVPSFLTGTLPCQHGVYEGSARARIGAVTDVLPEDLETLAERFQQEGYQTAAFVKNAQLRRGNGFEQGFDTYRDEVGDAQEIRWQATDWLDARDERRPFFVYLHLLDVHWPYPVPDEYASRFASPEDATRFRGGDSRALRDAINDGEVPFGKRDRDALRDLYDGALSYVDEQLGQLLGALADRGLRDSTVVSVMSDHGEEFGERGRIGHGHGLSEGLLRVPWILHVPGRAPRRHAAPVSLLDLFPTLLAAARLDTSGSHLGTDRLLDPEGSRPLLAEHKAPDKYLQAFRSRDAKLLRTFRPPSRVLDGPASLLAPGSRWEAELPVGVDTGQAVRMKPRDEDPDDPTEVKGPIADLEEGSFLLGAVRCLFAEADVIPTSGALDTDLYPGRMVKVRGDVSGGELVLDRIKVYPRQKEPEHEIRGTLGSVQVAGDEQWIVDVGGLAVLLTKETKIEDPRDEVKPRMERAQVVRALELGSGAVDEGFQVELELLDLPGEDPLSDEETLTRYRASLDRLAAEYARDRRFDADDRVTLTAEVLAELRALGYVK